MKSKYIKLGNYSNLVLSKNNYLKKHQTNFEHI